MSALRKERRIGCKSNTDVRLSLIRFLWRWVIAYTHLQLKNKFSQLLWNLKYFVMHFLSYPYAYFVLFIVFFANLVSVKYSMWFQNAFPWLLMQVGISPCVYSLINVFPFMKFLLIFLHYFPIQRKSLYILDINLLLVFLEISHHRYCFYFSLCLWCLLIKIPLFWHSWIYQSFIVYMFFCFVLFKEFFSIVQLKRYSPILTSQGLEACSSYLTLPRIV